MKTRFQKHALLLFTLLIACLSMKAQDNVSYKNGFLADKPKKMLIELKAGHGFLSDKPSEGNDYSKVFYGGGNVSFGLMLRSNFLGVGAGAEYVDLVDGSYDFPVFLNFQHFFSEDMEQGFFAGAKLGYTFGGKRSMEDIFVVNGNEELGTNFRSMQGVYGEVCAGYRIRGVNLFVAYNYRTIGNKVILSNPLYESPFETYSRDLHVVMAGVSFLPF